MKPPFSYTAKIIEKVAAISELLGSVKTRGLTIPSPQLRKNNQIKTIFSTLAIEGNTLSESQISDVIHGKRVRGKASEILEVKNALKLYEQIKKFKYYSLKDFLRAHKILMMNLVPDAGKFRNKNVGILDGKRVVHAAPSPKIVPEKINEVFSWLKTDKETHLLLKSCIAHYEIEFIHPFMDGNGRMGRFWQTLILKELNSIFIHLPIESIIKDNQKKYYESLRKSDKSGESTVFTEFMLNVIELSLLEFIENSPNTNNIQEQRLQLAKVEFEKIQFSRQEYLRAMPEISTATASRDLRRWIDTGVLYKTGEKNQTRYFFK